MHQATFYKCGNQMQRNDAEKITEEDHLQWRLDGGDTLLDVGCGSGDVLMDYIYPLLPKDFGLLMGTDISSKMVDYAEEHYNNDGRVKFRVLDIASDELPNELCEQFDHVTSFYCLHWVQDQRKALRNIHKLLRKNDGDCLLVFLASAPLYDIYATLNQKEKWSPYMIDIKRYISPLHFCKNPVDEFNKMLTETGFVDCNVELRDRVHYFRNAEVVKDSVKAICPFLDLMPSNEQQEFLDDFLSCVQERKLYEIDDETKELRFFSPYKLIVAYGRKSNSFFTSVIGNNETIKGLN